MTTMIHVRVDEALKDQASEALSKMGLSTSDAVRLLFKRIVAEQAFPFELKVPNAETLAAMEESKRMMRESRARFMDADGLFKALDQGLE